MRVVQGNAEPVTVLVRGGTYRLSETFTLTAADSGVTSMQPPRASMR